MAKEKGKKSADETLGVAPSAPPLLVEIAYEVCQQVGGIYTVIRSKVPSAVAKYGDRYLLVGPWNPASSPQEFEETAPEGPFGAAFDAFLAAGYTARYGRWLISGRPRVILLDMNPQYHRLGEIKYDLYQHHGVNSPDNDFLYNEVVTFGFMIQEFLRILAHRESAKQAVIAHFHEWMAGSHLPSIRRQNIPVTTVFTTHATYLGRCLAMNDGRFYDHLPFYQWEAEAKRFNIEPQNLLERFAAHSAHVFTTVSDLTALECRHLVGREVDLLLPNGLNIERFVAMHESQVLHKNYKDRIHQFTMGHFFPSYSFDLDNTLYLFTSGRYEYRNKGFDLTLEALARLNWRLKQAGSPVTVVCFFITKRPGSQFLGEVLSNMGVMEEMKKTVDAIGEQVKERLFTEAAMGRMPDINSLVDDYWSLRLRRNQQAWKTKKLPPVVTHSIPNDAKDEILAQLRTANLVNGAHDPVKVVYHPDFVTANNPLFGMDYDQFVRGCHLGIFPSYYEPWGYTPLECIARGIPAVTSDLSGFGSWLLKYMPEIQDKGVFISKRRLFSWDETANQLADFLFQFATQSRRERISLRNQVEALSDQFDWRELGKHYDGAYALAQKRLV